MPYIITLQKVLSTIHIMKKKYFSYIIVFVLMLFAASVLASADGGFFVNDDVSVLPEDFDGVYAIGSGGTELLNPLRLYALTSSGVQRLGTSGGTGGGGLTVDKEPVKIFSDRVRVGLAYTFTDTRDCSVASAAIENTAGGGFSLGYYDEYEDFVTLESTEERTLTFRPGPDGAVDVFTAGSSEPFYTMEETSKDAYLIVRAEPVEDDSDEAEPLIRYSGISYRGDFCFAVLGNDRLTVVNYVDLDSYVMGVCAIEMTESWPFEALKAQAVAARTFVQRMIGRSAYYYGCGFDVTADTFTQAYHGTRGVGDNIMIAVEETENEYLTLNGELIDALYSASDGGATEDSENVTGNKSSYLVGVQDPYEELADEENPFSSWTVTMTPAQLGARLGIGPVSSVTATTSPMGNVIKLEFVSSSGQTAILLRDNCRTKLGLNSIRFEISKDSRGYYVFEGSGCGHALGMSQWGAYAMAKYCNKDYRFILGYYYTDVFLSFGELPPKPERPEQVEPEAPDEPDEPDVLDQDEPEDAAPTESIAFVR